MILPLVKKVKICENFKLSISLRKLLRSII